MTAPLTTEEVKQLKESCKPGVLLPVMIFIIGDTFIVGLSFKEHSQNILPLVVLLFFLCLLIGYLMLRKRI